MLCNRLAVCGIPLTMWIFLGIATAFAAPGALADGDILLDASSFADSAAARTVWRPVGDSLPVDIGQIAAQRVVLLPCGFADRPTMTVAQWQRKLAVDLTGRLGLQIDVYSEESDAIASVSLDLLDAAGCRVAAAKTPLAPGWNVVTVTKSESINGMTDLQWAAIGAVGITVTPARQTNTALAVTNLRVVGPDPLISLTRLRDHDVIETQDGQTVRGMLLDRPYTLNTRFGPLTFSSEHVVGLQATRASASMVRILLTDGEVFTGTLSNPEIVLAAATGGVIRVPIQQISRCAYRISPAKPFHRMPDRPTLVLPGCRTLFELTDDFRFELATEHGAIALAPSALTRLDALGDVAGRWRASLTNGSVLIGTLSPTTVAVTLRLPDDRSHPVRISASEIQRFNWRRRAQAPTDVMTVELADGQRLYGRIDTETLAVGGEFGAQDVPISDIVSMTLSQVDTGMATLNLWGGKVLKARMLDPTLAFTLPGLDITILIKAERIRSIASAGALSTPQFTAKIERLIRNLDSPNETEREIAFKELIRAGAPAAPLIRQHLGDPDPIIRQRLLEILARI